MSRRPGKRPRKTPGDPYKRGYANGVSATAEAVLDDLDEHGLLDDVEYGEDGTAEHCNACILREHHFPRLAERLSFTYGLDAHGAHLKQPGDEPEPVDELEPGDEPEPGDGDEPEPPS